MSAAADPLGEGKAAAYSSEISVVLVLSISERCATPSVFTLLPLSLQPSAGQKCQRLLTLWAWARSGALERGERRVDLEHLGEALRALDSDAVAPEAANEGGAKVSAAADSVMRGRAETHPRLVSVLLVLSTSTRVATPSAFRLVLPRLQARAGHSFVSGC